MDTIAAEAACKLVARPPSLHFIGDSHVEIFSGLLFEAAPGKLFQTKSHNHHYFRAAEFTTPEGVLNERLARSMVTFGFLRTTQEADGDRRLPQLSTSQHVNAITESLKTAADSTQSVLVLSCGEIDSRDILSKIPAESDFLLPFDVLIPFARTTATQHIQTNMLVEFISKEYLAPLLEGLRLMRSLGFTNIFLHSLPPPTTDDEDSRRVQGFHRPANLRYKLTYLLNELMRRGCHEAGITYLDTWPAVTSNGALDRRYYLDGLHLNKAAAIITVQAVMDCLRKRGALDVFLQHAL